MKDRNQRWGLKDSVSRILQVTNISMKCFSFITCAIKQNLSAHSFVTCLIRGNWRQNYKSFVFPSMLYLLFNTNCQSALISIVRQQLSPSSLFLPPPPSPSPSFLPPPLLPFPNPFSPPAPPLSPQGLPLPPIASLPTQRPPDCTRTMELI